MKICWRLSLTDLRVLSIIALVCGISRNRWICATFLIMRWREACLLRRHGAFWETATRFRRSMRLPLSSLEGPFNLMSIVLTLTPSVVMSMSRTRILSKQENVTKRPWTLTRDITTHGSALATYTKNRRSTKKLLSILSTPSASTAVLLCFRLTLETPIIFKIICRMPWYVLTKPRKSIHKIILICIKNQMCCKPWARIKKRLTFCSVLTNF